MDKSYTKKQKTHTWRDNATFKRPEMFLAEGWPSYFEKTKGCKVWTLDKDVLIDAAYMGVGTNVLGYSNENVDKKVIENVQKEIYVH